MSLKHSSYVVQGITINLSADDELLFHVSNYFHPLYHGEKIRRVKPVTLELRLVHKPPGIPADLVKSVQGPFVTTYSNGRKVWCATASGSGICLDPTTMKADGFFEKDIFKKTPELFSLLGTLIVETMRYYGLHFLHAAAILVDGTAYLISGDGGCGKTTNALNLVRQGFQYVTDDSLFLKAVNGKINVVPLYKHFHIHTSQAKRFPELSEGGSLGTQNIQKVRIDISERYPGSFIPFLQPDVIIFPRIISAETSRVNPLTQTDTYKKLLKQTVLAVDTQIARKQLSIIEKLVKQTTGFELLSGRDIYEDPAKLTGLMRKMQCKHESSTKV